MPTQLGFATNVKIGANVNSVEDVKIEPHVEFLPGLVERGTCREDTLVSSARCRWTYPDRLLSGEQFYQLQSLVGEDASASVVIDIPTQTLDLSTYTPEITTYNAIMHWPAEGVTRVAFNLWQFPDEGILFTRLASI
jgi:hypothetical protein